MMVVVTEVTGFLILFKILQFALCAVKGLNFCEIQYLFYCRINEGNCVCLGRFVPTNQCQCWKVNCRITDIYIYTKW